MYHKNLRQSHVYPDILSVVFIYCIVDPELRNTVINIIMQNKESDNIDKKTVSSILS